MPGTVHMVDGVIIADTRNDPDFVNERTIRQQALAALAANRTAIAAAKPGTAAAQASAAYDGMIACRRQLNGVIRLLLNALDGTD